VGLSITHTHTQAYAHAHADTDTWTHEHKTRRRAESEGTTCAHRSHAFTYHAVRSCDVRQTRDPTCVAMR
jgi:hypothetical protein